MILVSTRQCFITLLWCVLQVSASKARKSIDLYRKPNSTYSVIETFGRYVNALWKGTKWHFLRGLPSVPGRRCSLACVLTSLPRDCHGTPPARKVALKGGAKGDIQGPFHGTKIGRRGILCPHSHASEQKIPLKAAKFPESWNWLLKISNVS